MHKGSNHFVMQGPSEIAFYLKITKKATWDLILFRVLDANHNIYKLHQSRRISTVIITVIKDDVVEDNSIMLQ